MTEGAKYAMTRLGSRMGYSYDAMMEIAKKASENGTFCFGDDDLPEQFYAIKEEMFELYSQITGNSVNAEDIYFRCAC